LKESIAEWTEEKIERQLQQKGIKWVLQPPALPHMSGIWERLVQTAKKHLKNVVGDGLLKLISGNVKGEIQTTIQVLFNISKGIYSNVVYNISFERG